MTDYQITATDHGDAATLNGGDPVEILVTIPSSGGGGGGAVDSVNGETGVVVLSAADVGAQPVDSDLTAIAALTTTTFGRSLLALADAAALRTSAGLGTAATQATSAFDAAGAASSAQAASQPLDSDLTAIAALTTTSFGRSLLTAADAAAARVLTGAGTSSLALGTSSSTAKAGDYQPAAANISDATTIGKSVLTAADAAAVRTAIGAGTSSFDGVYASLTSKPTLGTAAAKDVPATGDASSSQVVYGTDTRLTDARTPTTHSHAESDVTGLVSDLAAKVPTTRTVGGHALSADVTLVKGDVGLGNVDNTADASKTFTESQVTNLTTDLAAKAPLASPTFTGHPVGVTESPGNNSTRLATTAYADAAVAAGGGGGGGGAVSILAAPISGQSTIDEFNDSSLDAAFVQVDKSGGSGRVIWAELGEALYCYLAGGDSAAESHAMVKPLSGYGGAMVTTDAIIGHVNVGQPASGNFTMAGVILADGTSNAGGKQVLSFVYPGWGVAEDTTNYSVAGTLNQSGISSLPRITESFWVRLVKTGTSTWRTDHSYNGVHWVTGPTANQSFTPTHVGVFGSSWGGAVVGHVSFDCIRRVTGVA